MSSTPSFDAVVVGSGFGGSISALRVAERGRSVLVLERGRRYLPGEFPREVRDTNALLWRYPQKPRSQGLYDIRFFSSLTAVVASGVDGGSLIYANIQIRPDASVFDDPRWPAGTDRAALDPYYDRVARELGVAPLPASLRLPKRDEFRAAAARLGHRVFDPDQAVSWTDPGVPGRGPCQLVAECEFGCQHGAKNTLDFTYLARAEALGAEVRPRSFATGIEPAPTGYRVHYRDLTSGRSTRSPPGASWSAPGHSARPSCCCAAATWRAHCPRPAGDSAAATRRTGTSSARSRTPVSTSTRRTDPT